MVTAQPIPSPAHPSRFKLPVWATVAASYKFVACNMGQLARVALIPLLIMLPVVAAATWLAQSWVPNGAGIQSRLTGQFVEWIVNQIPIPFLATIAVAWHRMILLGERVEGWINFRFDREVCRYAVLTLILSAVITLPLLVPITPLYGFVVATIGLGLVFFVLPRVSLMLPAVAIGAELSWKEAWWLTRSNTLRLAFAYLLCTLVPAIPIAIAVQKFGLREGLASSEGRAVMSIVGAISATVAVTFLSLAYRHFIRWLGAR